MTTVVKANDESYARHLAMIKRWGPPTGIYGPDYKGRGLSLIEKKIEADQGAFFMLLDDPFDPNLIVFIDNREWRIYGDDNAATWCIVSPEDYQWAIQWRWHINKPHPSRNGTKQYFVRSLSRGGNYKPKLYLHVEIMKRTGILPPCPLHTIVDHDDGDEWNCRRGNLFWATPKQNRSNIRGQKQFQIV